MGFCFFVLVLVPCLECAFLAAARVCTGCVARRLAVGLDKVTFSIAAWLEEGCLCWMG